MNDRLHRWSLVAGPLAVVLWIVGIVTVAALTDSLSDGASDGTILAWFKGNAEHDPARQLGVHGRLPLLRLVPRRSADAAGRRRGR